MEYTREELEQMADSLPFWWHSIDLGHGVKTKGVKAGGDMANELKALASPNFAVQPFLTLAQWMVSTHLKRSDEGPHVLWPSITIHGRLIWGNISNI
jgi:hypothetical protein